MRFPSREPYIGTARVENDKKKTNPIKKEGKRKLSNLNIIANELDHILKGVDKSTPNFYLFSV